jgi:ABC-2 type transporter
MSLLDLAKRNSFFQFDSITLLSAGETVYSGLVSDVFAYFEMHNFPCPPHVNPADHLIDISTVDSRSEEAEQRSSARVNTLIASWRRAQLTSSSLRQVATAPQEASIQPPGVSIFRQIWYLTTRNFWITIRDPFGLGGFLFEALIIGTVVGWIFYDIPPTLTGIRSMQGFIYTVLGLQGYLLLLFTTWKVSVDMKVTPSFVSNK